MARLSPCESLGQAEKAERAGQGLLLNSAVRTGGHTHDALKCFDEGADAVVANGKACFGDRASVR